MCATAFTDKIVNVCVIIRNGRSKNCVDFLNFNVLSIEEVKYKSIVLGLFSIEDV